MPSNLHHNEGVVLLGIVQIILGFVFIFMAYAGHKILPSKESLTRMQRLLLPVWAMILAVVFLSIQYYLNLPGSGSISDNSIKMTISIMGLISIGLSYFIENLKLERKSKRITLFTFLAGKKISYFHLCLMAVGVLFVWLGYDSIFN
jgi:hypothetical protein